MNKHVCVCANLYVYMVMYAYVEKCEYCMSSMFTSSVHQIRVFPPERMRKAMPAAAATGPDEQMRRLPKEPMWTIQWAVAYIEKKS